MAQQKIHDNVTFHYVKTNEYRTIFASGAIGGINVQGLIHMNLFIDRPVIPRKVSYSINGNLLGDEVDREARDGAIREIQMGAIFDISAAKNLVLWLNQQIEAIEGLQKQ